MESDGEPGWRAYVDEKDPVHAACQTGDLEAVCELLEGAGREWLEGQQGTNFDINTPSQAKGNREGWTPLFYAATSGDEQVVEYLLTKRADVNARDAIGNRSLTYAHGPYVRKILRSLMTREESKAEAWKLHGIACEKIKEHLQSLEEVSRLHELKASNLLTSSYVAYKISERKKASAPTGEEEKQEPIFEDVEDKLLQSKISGCNQRIESLSSEVLQKFRQSFVALLQAWELHGNIGQSWNKVQRQLSVYNGIPPDVETMNRCQSCLDKAQIGKDQEKLTLTELESLSRIVSGVLPMKEALMNFLQRHSKDGRYAILLTDFAFAFEDFETICEIFNLQDRIDSCLKTHFEALNAYHEDTLDEHNFDLAERAQMMTEHALRTSNEEFQTKIAQQFGFSSLTNFLNATKTSISTKRMRVNHLFAFIKKMEVSGILLERIDFLRSSQFTRLQAQVTITELEDLLRTAKQDLKTCSEPAHANSALLLLLSSIVLSKRAADTSGMQQQRRKIEVPDEILEVLMRDRDDLLHHILFKSFPKLFDGPSTQDLVSQENMSRDQFVMRYKSFIREFWLQSANSKLKQTVQQCAERRRRLASYLTALGALAEAEDRFADADYAYSKRRSKEAKELFLKSETKEYNLLCREMMARSEFAYTTSLEELGNEYLEKAGRSVKENDFDSANVYVEKASGAFKEISPEHGIERIEEAKIEIKQCFEERILQEMIPWLEELVRKGDFAAKMGKYDQAVEIYSMALTRCKVLLEVTSLCCNDKVTTAKDFAFVSGGEEIQGMLYSRLSLVQCRQGVINVTKAVFALMQ